MLLRGTAKAEAKVTITALLAFPFSGGFETRIFKALPSHPATLFWDEPGTTFKVSLAAIRELSLSNRIPADSGSGLVWVVPLRA